MRHRTDQPIDRPSGESRVGVESDDVADAGRRDGTRSHEARVRRPAQEAIQLVELAPLALPPHPRPLAVVPEPAAMEEEESLAAIRCGTVTSVQAGDPLARGPQSSVITRHALRGRIQPVGEDGKAK